MKGSSRGTPKPSQQKGSHRPAKAPEREEESGRPVSLRSAANEQALGGPEGGEKGRSLRIRQDTHGRRRIQWWGEGMWKSLKLRAELKKPG